MPFGEFLLCLAMLLPVRPLPPLHLLRAVRVAIRISYPMRLSESSTTEGERNAEFSRRRLS